MAALVSDWIVGWPDKSEMSNSYSRRMIVLN